jgi:hypothetical protein
MSMRTIVNGFLAIIGILVAVIFVGMNGHLKSIDGHLKSLDDKFQAIDRSINQFINMSTLTRHI